MNDKLKIGQKKYGNFEKSARLKQLIFALGVKQTVFAAKMGGWSAIWARERYHSGRAMG